MSNDCPCKSGKEFDNCCGPFLSGDKIPMTAEALMRSRYTAFTRADVNYIRDTRHPRSENRFDEKATLHWARDSKWLGLEIMNTDGGQKDDVMGTVEFMARYVSEGEKQDHHEVANFQKGDDQRWYFVDGDFIRPDPFVRETPKVGRNEPCICGSGKKFKKCCGKN